MSSKNTISVKVKVSVLIDALRKSLAEREERYANNEKAQADFEKAHKKWEADFTKAVVALVKNGKGKVKKATEVSRFYRHEGGEGVTYVEVTVEVPKSISQGEPQRPETYNEWEYKSDKEAITQAIRVLEMCDSETVSTSTYHSVVKYL
jgi:hypothetical protein